LVLLLTWIKYDSKPKKAKETFGFGALPQALPELGERLPDEEVEAQDVRVSSNLALRMKEGEDI
jgi:hypothetical protein